MPSRLMLVRVTWVWQSNSPGSRQRPPRSTASSPSRPGPTATTRPPSTTTSASAGAGPLGGEQVVGEADHVAPRVGHLDQPAGAQLAGPSEQAHPGGGQGLAGRP